MGIFAKSHNRLSQGSRNFAGSRLHWAVLAALGGFPIYGAAAVTETDQSSNFPVGSNGYQANVPSTSANLLALSGTGFSASQNPNGGENTSTDYATLTDGIFGPVPNSGGGGPGDVAIKNNTTLTYTLNSPTGYNLSSVDIFSNWGDDGRVQPKVTVKYATVDNPGTFVVLKDVDYRPTGVNGAWVSLTTLGLDSIAVSKLQFVFGNQQNNYVGYTELAAQGTAAVVVNSGKIWSGETNNNWDVNTTVNWTGAKFNDGDDVRFQDTNGNGGAVTNSNLVIQAAGVKPASVVFANSSVPYTVTNAGSSTTGISGAASVAVIGGGNVTFNSPNTYTGGTKVNNGTLTIANTGTLGSANGVLQVGGTGVLDLGGTTQTVGQLGTSAVLGVTGTVQNGTINIKGNNAYLQGGTFTADLTSTPRSVDPNTQGRLWIGGDSTATLLLGGNNTVQFADTNSTIIGYPVTGAAGIVRLLTPTALGPATENAQIFTGTVDLFGVNNVTVKSLMLADSSSALVNSSAANSSTYGGEIHTNSGTPVVGGTGNMTLTGVVSGGGGLRKLGAGLLTLPNTNNSYSGVTIFEGGIVNVASLADYGQNSSLGNRDASADGGQNVSMLFRGGTLQYTGSTPQSTNRPMRISIFNGGGTIDASGSSVNATLNFTAPDSPDWWEEPGNRTLTLTGSNTGANTLATRIRDLAGITLINLEKTGSGTWYLTSTNSNYKGQTIISGGILNVAALSDYGVDGSLGNRDAAGDQNGTDRAFTGILFRGGTLQYTGSTPTSTNRFIRLSTAGGTIDASGTDPNATVSFTANAVVPNFFENAGLRTLTLTGSNTGNNTFTPIIEEFVDPNSQLVVTNTGLAKSGTGTWVVPVAQLYAGATTVNGGLLKVTGSIANSSGLTVNSGGTYEAGSSQSIKTVTINAGGTVKISGGTPFTPSVLKLGDNVGIPFAASGNGTLDLQSGAVALDLAPGDVAAGLVAARTAIIAGVNVKSSTAALNPSSRGIGYALASDLGIPDGGTFLGTTVDSSTVLARYTLLGDANLDGTVNFNDLVRLAQNYNVDHKLAGPGFTDSWWYSGDFTGDGVTNFNDLVKLAQNYNSSLPNAGAIPGAPAGFGADLAAAFASVPEPTSMGLIALGALGMLRRRRRA